MKRWLFVLILVLALVLTACGAKETEVVVEPDVEDVEDVEEDTEPAEAVELRFMYYADGNEAEVMQGLLDDFMAENSDISVVLDVVPYATIDEQLPIQVETGEGPDLARITNFGAYSGELLDLRTYVSDAAFYQANFPAPILYALGYGGYPDAFTVTGPYVNVTLFEQAGVDLLG